MPLNRCPETYPNSPKCFSSYPRGWCVVRRDDGRHGVVEQRWDANNTGASTIKYQVRWRPTRRSPATLSMHGSRELRSATAREVAGLTAAQDSCAAVPLEPSCTIEPNELA